MIKKSFCLLSATLLSLAAAWAADPDQVGDYAGTIKSKVYTGTTKTNVKSELLLSIAADDSTTVTIGGVQVGSEAIFQGPMGVLLFETDPTTNTLMTASLEFKKGRFKGTATGFVLGPPVKTSEAKISLKKVTP